MRKLKYELDRQFLETIYLTFIRPVLEYANVVWDNCTHYEKEELEKIQRQQELLQALPNVFLYTLFMEKLVGILWTRDAEITNSHYFIRFTPTEHLLIYQH